MSILTEWRKLQREAEEVLSRHDEAKSIIDFARYANDPHGFFVDVLRCHPWEMQVAIAEAVRDHPRVVVSTANGVGKDWVTARIALWWVFARRGFCILTGPGERQVKTILMREIRQAFSLAPELPGELLSLELRVDDDSECGILAMTSNDADRLVGYHHPRLLICVTEGQGIEPEAFEAAIACCTGAQNKLYVYGNPVRPSGPFFDFVERKENWHKLTVSAEDHPNIKSGKEQIAGAISVEWINSLAEEYGVTSDIYRSRVLAQFPGQSASGLFNRDWIRAAFARHGTDDMVMEAAQHPLTLSLDVARSDAGDMNTLAHCRGPIVERIDSWHERDTMKTLDRVAATAEASYDPRGVNANRFPHLAQPPRLVIDVVGLGGGLVDAARRLKPNKFGDRYSVYEFNGGSAALDDKRFINKRAESHWAVRDLLKAGKAVLPRDRMLEEEMTAIEWQTNPSASKIQILSKELVRKAIKRSPDRCDAAVMGLAFNSGVCFYKSWTGTYYI